jgi:CelD/BcsL family acetyltransferase involved in cellulose biosynthesis
MKGAEHRSPATVEAMAPDACSLTCEVATDFAALAALRPEWDRLAESSGDLYGTYDWCRIWWQFYGAGRRLCVLVFRTGSALTGVLPMFIERVWLGPVWLRVAKLLSSDFAQCVLSPSLEAGSAREVLAAALQRLVREMRCDAVCFGPLSGEHGLDAALRAAASQLSQDVTLERDVVLAPHTVFTLPASFDAYLESLPKRQRGNCRRDSNLLAKSFSVSTDEVHDARAYGEEFDRFRTMHDRQWQAEGKLGHFGDWPQAAEFNRSMARAQAELGRLHLVRLLLDGNVVSYQYCYLFGDCCYWRLPARLVGEDWDRYGMGRMGLVKMIETMIGLGARRIEAGAGHYEYKVQLGGVEHPLRSMVLVANRLGTRLRARAFARLADFLNFAYYRGWFTRIAPRLARRPRPLWPLWIRSRL